jgi:Holliday junction resolvase
MSSYNKVKGSKFETDVMKYLRKLGHFAERLAKAGSSDEGDIVTVVAGQTYILECKNRKKIDLPAFWDEARAEARNYAKARGISVNPLAFVIVKRKNKGIEDAWVIQNLDQWLEEKTMPTPQGEITSTEIIKPKEEKKEDK